MNNHETPTRRPAQTKTQKGCMHLAPGGEMVMAVMSIIGWLTFLVKFAII